MKLLFTALLSLQTSFILGQNHSKHAGPCKPDTSINGTEIYKHEKIVLQDLDAISNQTVKCVNFKADGYDYPCSNIVLESFVPNRDLYGGASTTCNDIWGWTSPDTGIEYALIGLEEATSFVSLEDPNNPVVLGILPTHSDNPSIWRDIKTYGNYAFIVAEASEHGMQVFDLSQLDNVNLDADADADDNDWFNNWLWFDESAHYDSIDTVHNLFINEDSGFAYLVGGNGQISCESGLHMVNITDPLNPEFAGCYADQGYTHDVQCVIYDGPDTNYVGQEICFACNEDKLDIIDVTDKNNPLHISNFTYDMYSYVHQGWLTEDKHYFLIDDEGDERRNGIKTRTIICDVSDLQNPTLADYYSASNNAIDHNMFVKGDRVYQANYRAGLRVLDLSDISEGKLKEVGYFDVWASDDDSAGNGAWGNYPYFESGIIVLSSVEQGLFVLREGKDEITPIFILFNSVSIILDAISNFFSWISDKVPFLG